MVGNFLLFRLGEANFLTDLGKKGNWRSMCGNNYYFSSELVRFLNCQNKILVNFFQRAPGLTIGLAAALSECVRCGSKTTKRWSACPRRCNKTGRSTGTTGRAGRSRVAGASGRGARPRARTHSSRASAGPKDSRTMSKKDVSTSEYSKTAPG